MKPSRCSFLFLLAVLSNHLPTQATTTYLLDGQFKNSAATGSSNDIVYIKNTNNLSFSLSNAGPAWSLKGASAVPAYQSSFITNGPSSSVFYLCTTTKISFKESNIKPPSGWQAKIFTSGDTPCSQGSGLPYLGLAPTASSLNVPKGKKFDFGISSVTTALEPGGIGISLQGYGLASSALSDSAAQDSIPLVIAQKGPKDLPLEVNLLFGDTVYTSSSKEPHDNLLILTLINTSDKPLEAASTKKADWGDPKIKVTFLEGASSTRGVLASHKNVKGIGIRFPDDLADFWKQSTDDNASPIEFYIKPNFAKNPEILPGGGNVQILLDGIKSYNNVVPDETIMNVTVEGIPGFSTETYQLVIKKKKAAAAPEITAFTGAFGRKSPWQAKEVKLSWETKNTKSCFLNGSEVAPNYDDRLEYIPASPPMATVYELICNNSDGAVAQSRIVVQWGGVASTAAFSWGQVLGEIDPTLEASFGKNTPADIMWNCNNIASTRDGKMAFTWGRKGVLYLDTAKKPLKLEMVPNTPSDLVDGIARIGNLAVHGSTVFVGSFNPGHGGVHMIDIDSMDYLGRSVRTDCQSSCFLAVANNAADQATVFLAEPWGCSSGTSMAFFNATTPPTKATLIKNVIKARRLAPSPDGKFLYLSNVKGELGKIDLSAKSLPVKWFREKGYTNWRLAAIGGGLVYTSASKIDGAVKYGVAIWDTTKDPADVTFIESQETLASMAANFDGSAVMFGLYQANSAALTAIDTATHDFHPWPFPDREGEISNIYLADTSPDGSKLFAVGYGKAVTRMTVVTLPLIRHSGVDN